MPHKPKPKTDRSIAELIAAGKALKERADKAYARFVAITEEIQKTKDAIKDRRSSGWNPSEKP